MIIKEISSEATYHLRIKILRNGIAKNYKFKEDNFESTIHLGSFISNQCVGILTLIQNAQSEISNKDSYQLRGMAINESFQRQGIGQKLVLESFKILRNKEVEQLWCNARIKATEFYAKLGFKTIGKAFNIPSIGLHFTMSIDISSR